MTRTRNQRSGALLLGTAGLTLLTAAPLPAQLVATLQGRSAEVGSVCFSPDGKRLVSACFGEVKVWEVQIPEAFKKPGPHEP
jgi:WD40 repeat protein